MGRFHWSSRVEGGATFGVLFVRHSNEPRIRRTSGARMEEELGACPSAFSAIQPAPHSAGTVPRHPEEAELGVPYFSLPITMSHIETLMGHELGACAVTWCLWAFIELR
jgi:hypothetical protein